MNEEELKGIENFKCYAGDCSCVDCEYKEGCNIFVYVQQELRYKQKVKEDVKRLEAVRITDNNDYITIPIDYWIDFKKELGIEERKCTKQR